MSFNRPVTSMNRKRFGQFTWAYGGTLLLIVMMLMARASTSADPPPQLATPDFDEVIAPILVHSCLECHREAPQIGIEPSGGLDLSTRESMVAGGESGPAVVEGNLDASLIWKKVSMGEMPPESSLTEAEKQSLRDWISGGATWGQGPLDLLKFTTDKRAGYDWWSLQPIVDPPVPKADANITNPIDAFVNKRLAAAGMKMSPPAPPRTLVRRLAATLTGMHADFETLRQFEASEGGQAYTDLVDQYLQSHHYGERWARHWLDLARFGESQGFERDKSREHAWRYRDWVIRALNSDMPYDQFARMQIAGDCLQQYGRDGVIATGFLVACPYDEVGQSQQSAAMRAVVRQDEMDDYVGTVCQTFLGLTANCARCHDHKFDPIRQAEYYALCSSLDGVRPGDRDITPPEAIRAAEQKANHTADELRKLREQIDVIERAAIAKIAAEAANESSSHPTLMAPLAHWDFETDLKDRFGDLHAEAKEGARLEDGALVVDGKRGHATTSPLSKDIVVKTLSVRVTLSNLEQRGGGVISLINPKTAGFDSIVYGEREPLHWMAGSDGFRRTKSSGGMEEDEATRRPVHIVISYAADGTVKLYRDGKLYGSAYKTLAPPTYKAGESVVAFGIRHFPPGSNHMLAARIHEASLFDRVLDDDEVVRLFAGAEFITDAMIAEKMSAEQLTRHAALRQQIETLSKIDTKPVREFVYAVAPRQPEAATRVLIRGNPSTPAAEISPGGIATVLGVRADFGLAATAPEADRRRLLADWIASPNNPLFARVIVNRLWHHHFGAGLVTTPNDFGFSGGHPSHPELLDYLASRLIESNWSLKSIQKLIVTSATWQQASVASAGDQPSIGQQLDAGNRLLWRGNRARLDAETIRDSILMLSGQLNESVAGPPFKDFETFNFNSQFYEVTDPIGKEFNRRTIYRMNIRSGRHRMLDAFDCPDPSATAPKRPSTTTPLQSLSLMNHAFVLRMANHFSDRVKSEAEDSVEAQVRRAVELAWCRQPSQDELAEYNEFVQSHGLAALCRVLINSNEFLYVD